ncbi:Phosphatidylinositol transfer protein 1 [Camellia lanceoleosa]|uniref:Phosphatidylinositol transfer protein 1 n=1 Tax=Camellia lanceoleosa TaxID=1840588 RepID=A0ACC0F1G6_9ERIC|nr:Phosphatidylinositol transfer protein 1 [Camellia lanceoleosa]
MMYLESVSTYQKFTNCRAKFLLGLLLLHAKMLLSCKRKHGMHTQDANQTPCFNKLTVTIETVHKPDNGRSENVHGLCKEQLAAREVEVIDIASSARDCWSYIIGTSNVNLSKFKSEKTGRGPLLQGWQDQHNPVMTAYKLVIIDAPYWGFGNRLEQTLLAGERALFLESHHNCFIWIDEWFGMTEEAIREFERGSYLLLNEKLDIQTWPPSKEESDGK